MIRIDAIKITIHTDNGPFGRTLQLSKGLNIIRANNTSGKSSLFGAILYGLGFEELLGGRNDKALQSVFKSVVKEISSEGKERTSQVIQSEIYLQVSNGKDTITTRRFVVNDKIKPQAVEVFFGDLVTNPNGNFERQPMYLHDKGSASNESIGFHKFLEGFIGANLPEIVNQEGKRVKLFLPLISSAHFIEQKAGWSDFYANLPFYGIRDASAKVFEYILNFDVFEIAAKRQEVQNQLRDINDQWTNLTSQISSVAKKGGGEIIGLPLMPEILTTELKPFLRFTRGDQSLTQSQLLSQLKEELEKTILDLHIPINGNLSKTEEQLEKLKISNEKYEILYEALSAEVSQDRERLRQYTSQLDNVKEDLRKNKDAEKLQKIGLADNIATTRGICPTCNQSINDTLLNDHIHILPMRIDENIKYLQAQHKMIEAFIHNLKHEIISKDIKISSLDEAIKEQRSRIRSLKKTLISDDRLPSEDLISRKVILERELSFLYRLREEFEMHLSTLFEIIDRFKKAKSQSLSISDSYLSPADIDKLLKFELYFKQLLQKFGFTSKPINSIKISQEKYLPVYEIILPNGIKKQVDIRFESSASDFIRAQWAYYTALMNTSIKSNGNHFLTLIFDEPQQQSASTNNFKIFLSELESYRNEQAIVLASFQNSEDDFKEATRELEYTKITDLSEANQLFVQRLDN